MSKRKFIIRTIFLKNPCKVGRNVLEKKNPSKNIPKNQVLKEYSSKIQIKSGLQVREKISSKIKD